MVAMVMVMMAMMVVPVMIIPVIVAIVHLRGLATLLDGSGPDGVKCGWRRCGLGHRRGAEERRHRDRKEEDALHVSSPCSIAGALWPAAVAPPRLADPSRARSGAWQFPLRAIMEATCP